MIIGGTIVDQRLTPARKKIGPEMTPWDSRKTLQIRNTLCWDFIPLINSRLRNAELGRQLGNTADPLCGLFHARVHKRNISDPVFLIKLI